MHIFSGKASSDGKYALPQFILACVIYTDAVTGRQYKMPYLLQLREPNSGGQLSMADNGFINPNDVWISFDGTADLGDQVGKEINGKNQ